MAVLTNRIAESRLAGVIQGRRSILKVSNSPAVDRARVEAAIELALNAPTAFNMQSRRLVVLMGDSHSRFWDMVRETLRPLVPAENFAATEQRLQGFRGGAGTVLFFEDQQTIRDYQEKWPLYKDAFPAWSDHGSGMVQYALWLAFTADGVAASLQHYNPLIDAEVKRTWDVPEDWKLIAQMPFGTAAVEPQVPPKLPIEQVVKWS